MVSYGKGRLKMRRPSALTSLLVLLLFGILLSVPSIANVPTTAAHKEHAHAPDELLISFHPGTATEVINDSRITNSFHLATGALGVWATRCPRAAEYFHQNCYGSVIERKDFVMDP